MVIDWFRQQRGVTEEVAEDILGQVLRYRRMGSDLDRDEKIETANVRIRRSLNSLLRQGFLEQKQSEIRLTDVGRIEATQLVRAHRLWETYLQRAGVPEKEWHRKAHVLEHVSDDQTVDYLDDKLGHPLADPHGSEIPADIVHLDQNTDVRVSMLREGDRAVIQKVSDEVSHMGLSAGNRIAIGPRVGDGLLWTVILDGGKRFELEHNLADAIQVRLVQDRKE
jgi:manganese/iron transport system permease protein/iron/zinc/copper transport system permease protein